MSGGSTTAKPDPGTRTLTISVSGAPGVGKSALIDQLQRCMTRLAPARSGRRISRRLRRGVGAVRRRRAGRRRARRPWRPKRASRRQSPARPASATSCSPSTSSIVPAGIVPRSRRSRPPSPTSHRGSSSAPPSPFRFAAAAGDNIGARSRAYALVRRPEPARAFRHAQPRARRCRHLGDDAAHVLSEQFAAHIACVSDQELLPGRDYKLKLDERELTASVTAVKYRLDINSLHRVPARTLARGEIGVCTIATQYAADGRRLLRDPAMRTASSSATSIATPRSPWAPSISPCGAA